jgi:hypothetical protein
MPCLFHIKVLEDESHFHLHCNSTNFNIWKRKLYRIIRNGKKIHVNIIYSQIGWKYMTLYIAVIKTEDKRSLKFSTLSAYYVCSKMRLIFQDFNMKQTRPWMLANLKIIWQFYAHPVHQKVSRFFGPRYIGDDFFLGPNQSHSIELSFLSSILDFRGLYFCAA